MNSYAWVGLGGALGSIARYFVAAVFARLAGESFPWGTLLVNITGSLTIGLLATMMAPEGRLVVAPDVRRFLLAGVCGGYTTFSAFSLQTLDLILGGDVAGAAGNVIASVGACLLAVWAGASLGQALNHLPG